jgi:hypothetical protein
LTQVGEPASGEQLHLAIELEVTGVDDGQATGLQYANSERSERLAERDPLVVVRRVGHDGVHGLVREVGEHLPEVTRAKLPGFA